MNFMTFQEALHQANKKHLANLYFDKYVATDGHYQSTRKKFIKHFVKYLKFLDQHQTVNSDLVVFVNHQLDNDGLSQKPVANVQSLREFGRYDHRYSISDESLKKCLGILIIPTWMTRHYLDDLLVQLINDMTFNGWYPKQRKKHNKKLAKDLTKSIKQMENHPEKSMSVEDLKSFLGVKESDYDHFDRYEYQIYRSITMQMDKLWLHSFKRESHKAARLILKYNFKDASYNQLVKKNRSQLESL